MKKGVISGRINTYSNFEKKFNNYLNNEIHLFISINDNYDENKEFYDTFKNKFKKYIKYINIEKYIVPNNFKNTNIHTINNGDVYIRTLSCFYNDYKSFNLAVKYSYEESINYDIFIRYRTDIIVDSLPNFNDYDKNILYCVKPPNFFSLAITDNPKGEFKNGRNYCYGDIKYNGVYVTGDIAYGNEELMKIYCNCYNYILEKI